MRSLLRQETRGFPTGPPQSDHQRSLAFQVHASSPELQRAQADDGAYKRQNPEAHDDLRLLPALELVMMVDGRHQKHPFSAYLVRNHLKDDRERFHHEDTADDDQKNFILRHYRDDAQG